MKITKEAIQALATESVKAQYALETDKVIYLETVIYDGGFEISLTNNWQEWDRCIEWIEDKIFIDKRIK